MDTGVFTRVRCVKKSLRILAYAINEFPADILKAPTTALIKK